MTIRLHKFPLDLSGVSPENRMVDEPHRVGSIRQRVIVPKNGPFYGGSTHVVDAMNGKVLKPGTDYRLLHYYHEPSERSGQAVYAAILVLDPDTSGSLVMTVQHVGGEYSHVHSALAETALRLQLDTRPVYWSALSGVPNRFAPAPHYHCATDFTGWGPYVDANTSTAQAIREADHLSLAPHQRQVDTTVQMIDEFMHAVVDRYTVSLATLRAIDHD